MPKKLKKKRNGSENLNPKSMSQKTVRIPFRAFGNYSTTANSTAATVSEVNVSIATMGSRIVDAGDIFSEWRVLKLEVEATYSNANSTGMSDSTVLHAIGFTPTNSGSFTAISSMTQMCDLPCFAFGSGTSRDKFRVPTKLLRSIPEVWLNTSTTGTSELQYAGTLTYYVQNTTQATSVQWNQYIVVSGIAEFRGALDTANLPLEDLQIRIKHLQEELNRRASVEFEEVKEEKKSINLVPNTKVRYPK